jgi:hypothetical protein
MYCVSCEVRTEYIYMLCRRCRPPLWYSGQSSWLHIGDVLCFLWGTNWIYILVCYVEESRPPLWSSGQSSWLHNGDVLCFLWGTNWIYIWYVEESRPPLWASGQSSWLRSRAPGSISGATRFSEKQWVWNGVHSASWVQLRSCLEKKVAAPGLDIWEYGRREPSRWPRGTLYPQNFAVTSPTSGGRSVGIVRSRTQATEFFLCVVQDHVVSPKPEQVADVI